MTLSPGLRRRLAIYVLGPLALMGGYLLWQPGADGLARGARFQDNALWLGHGWLGDAVWFSTQGKSIADFGPDRLVRLRQRLTDLRIRDVYPHLCPADARGSIPAYDPQRARDLHAGLPGIRIIPWIGGSTESTVELGDVAWRTTFVQSAEALLRDPTFAGIQVNIEPLPTGDRDFLDLLDRLRVVCRGKILSVAAYPPPTILHPHPEVHWDLGYYREVARRVDQIVPMLYDTALRNRKLYTHLLSAWTEEILANTAPCEVLWGIPAYDDAGVPYHDPTVENVTQALRGIMAGLNRTDGTRGFGFAVYSEWTLDEKDADYLRALVAP